MKQRRIYLKELAVTVFLTAIIGQVYLYPFDAGFRFTAGVVVISFLLIYYSFIPEILLLTAAGMGVFIFRVFVDYLLNNYSLDILISIHYPAFFYYFFYGIFLRLFRIRAKLKFPLRFIMSMGIADAGANFLELIIRYKFNLVYIYSKSVFIPVLYVALIRSVSTFSIYWFMERHKLVIQAEENQKKYVQLLDMISELKAEFFYMQKSLKALEKTMKESYKIYQMLRSKELNEENVSVLEKRSLDLTKDIHEIKKDFIRITSGIKSLLPREEINGMSLKSIVNIIVNNTNKILKDANKQAVISVEIDKDLIALDYLSLFTILNNLILNSVDAIGNNGKIAISIKSDDQNAIFVIQDDGMGINPKDLPYIFEPGFSTKFTKDGNLSTGVGLTHVKALVEELKGTIKVDSKLRIGTRFEIRIPIYGNFQKS